MKTYRIFFVLVLILAAFSTQAQVQLKHSYDPSYSVHNYKHPDKAAFARKFNLERQMTFVYVAPEPTNAGAGRFNYKQQAGRTAAPTSGAVVPTAPESKNRWGLDSPANYKRQSGQ